jgi:hypothetical protein
MKMAVKTQGTQLFILDRTSSGAPEVMTVECAISIDGVGGAREQIEVTCLEDSARAYEAGLITPGSMTVTIQADMRNASHARLHELYVSGDKFDLAIGWGDGTAVPGLDTAGDFEFPTTRTYIEVEDVYVSDFPFNFELNAVVTSAVTFQLSGLAILYPKEVV